MKFTEELKIKELDRLNNMKIFENEYQNYIVCGIDEAGRGPLAGPVVAGCVVLNPECDIFFLNDSKKLSEKKRTELYFEIIEKALSYGIGIVDNKIIDEINILEATHIAMKTAYMNCNNMYFEKYKKSINCLLVDALKIKNIDAMQVPIIKGDMKSVSIAAASIIAKVTRDNLMIEYDNKYPNYNFKKHKGYGTKEHIENIKKFGLTDIHRKTFTKNIWIRENLGKNTKN